MEDDVVVAYIWVCEKRDAEVPSFAGFGELFEEFLRFTHLAILELVNSTTHIFNCKICHFI